MSFVRKAQDPAIAAGQGWDVDQCDGIVGEQHDLVRLPHRAGGAQHGPWAFEAARIDDPRLALSFCGQRDFSPTAG